MKLFRSASLVGKVTVVDVLVVVDLSDAFCVRNTRLPIPTQSDGQSRREADN